MKGYKGFAPGLVCLKKQYAENTVFEEEKADGFRYGWSDNYIRVRMPAHTVELNRIVPVLFTEENRVSGDPSA